jgi:hypothetical protein
MAGTISLDSILGAPPITALLRATTSGIPNPFPPEFSAVDPRNRFLGDRAVYRRIYGARTTVPLAAWGSAGRRVPLQPIAEQNVRMLYIALEFFIDCNQLARLTSFDSREQDKGIDWVRYQVEEEAKRMKNTEIVCMASMLRFGAIYWGGQGDILPSASGAAFTTGSQVPGTHQNQLNGIIAQSWALPNTDIFAHLRAIDLQSVQDSGLRVDDVLYGLNIPTYLQLNSTLQAFFVRNAGFRDKLVETGMIPDGFGGKRWRPCWEAFFVDQNGNNQLLWDNNLCVFHPKLTALPKDMAWWAYMQGSSAVLRGIGAFGDPMAAIANCPQEYGESGWSMPTFAAPLGVTVNLQSCFLPALKNELCLYQAEVAF